MNTNTSKISITTAIIIALLIACAISVAMLVGCEKNEFDADVPSPDVTPEGDYLDNDIETDFVTKKLIDGTYAENTKKDNTEEAVETEAKDTETEAEDTTTEPEETEETKETEEKEDEGNSSYTQSSDWKLILVNPWNYLPDDFSPNLMDLSNGHKVDARAYEDLQAMMDDCRAAGLSPYICSSYRTHDYQKGLHQRQINKYLSYGYSQDAAYAEASKWVAVAGTSEHQTGLALDIVASYYVVLDESQEDMPEQKWLMANSYKYGWILRYPNNTTDITGIYYEPWHYRYVGKEVAKEIHDRGITLEEYLGAS